MNEFEWKLKNNKTGEILMKGESIEAEREYAEEEKEIDNSWKVGAVSDGAVKFIRNSNEDELLIYLSEEKSHKFNLGEDYDIKIS